MDLLKGLNNEQKEAVLTPYKHVRVIAGAGSGKTRVLTTRIVHLIHDRGYNPKKICAITFTNKAANEMKTRMESMLPASINVHVSTIHSLCVRIIREEFEALGLVRNFTILDTQDQQAILKEAYTEYSYERKELRYGDVLNYISNNKIAGVSIEQAYAMAGSAPYEIKKAKIYDYYVNRMHELFSLDFDDLLIKVELLFKKNKDILKKWQNRYSVVLVDEFQDVDHIQYNIIDLLVGNENELYVVGDPDQTIYTWRGAKVGFITDFEKHYPKSTTILLNQNYRSTQNILDCANAIIKNNPDRMEKDLHANRENGDHVIYSALDDEESEGYWISRKIMELNDQGESYLDVAILYRSNYLSRSIEKSLVSMGIPYIVYGGLRFYDRQEIKDMMSYLRMVSHGDDLALRRSIGTPRRGIGTKTLEKLFMEATHENVSIFEYMQKQVRENTATAKIQKYVALIESFRAIYEENNSIEHLMQRILDASGLRQMYEKEEELERLENIKELMGEAIHFQEQYPFGTLEEYVQMVSLYGDRDEVIEGEYVRLMTVHAAKGLEFETVFMAGMNDDVFPNKNSILESKEGLLEERRLAYVAITRAKRRLFLSGNNGYSYVMGRGNRPSRFIKEMDGPWLLYENRGVITEQSIEEKVMASYDRTNHKKLKLKPADVIVHDDFGEGIVIQVTEDTFKIAFSYPHGTKTISRMYAGVRLKGALT